MDRGVAAEAEQLTLEVRFAHPRPLEVHKSLLKLVAVLCVVRQG